MDTDLGQMLKNIKIKDPITAGAIIGLVVALLCAVLAFRSYRGVAAEKQALRESLDAAQSAVEQVRDLEQANPEALRAKVTAKKQELTELLAGFPNKSQATDELARYYDYAKEYDAQLTRMEARLSSGEQVVQTAYQVESFMLEARGQFSDLMRFWMRLASGPYDTFALDNLAVQSDGLAIAGADLNVVYSDLAASGAPAQ